MDDERDREERETEEDEEREERPSEEDDDEERSSGSRGSETEDDGDDEDWQPERARKTIRNLRKREKDLDKRAKELERENKQFQRQNQSRDEQLTSDLEEKDTEISELRQTNESLVSENRRYSFVERMQAQGFTAKQARYAYKDLDEIGVEAEFDEKNRLTNPKAVRKAAKEYDSDMYATGSADGGQREKDSEGGTGGMNPMMRSAAGRC